jgi:cysteine desulfurase
MPVGCLRHVGSLGFTNLDVRPRWEIVHRHGPMCGGENAYCNYSRRTMIYLDYNATTPLDPEVADLVDHVARNVPGNAASVQHGVGNEAACVVEAARESVARTLGVAPTTVVWTSGASEGLHLAIVGLVGAAPVGKRTIVIAATEHKAALSSAEFCRRLLGAEVRLISPTTDGRVRAAAIEDSLDDTVATVVCMHVNNETGVINPVEEISQVCREWSIPLVCDVTQSLGKIDASEALSVADIAVFSAHKFYGPKGVGVLLADPSLRRKMIPAISGGSYGDGLRGGTLNTPCIAGLARALQLAVGRLDMAQNHYQTLSARLLSTLVSRVGDLDVVGGDSPRISNTLNLRFRGADAEAVMANAPEVAISTGSACNSADPEPSHVLLAMGMDPESASECLRISVGLPTTRDDVDEAALQISAAVQRVRRLTAA